MGSRQSRLWSWVITGALGLALAGTANASGFQLTEQGASGMGNAFAGVAATGEDASTVFWNPAGMNRIEGTQLVGVLHYVMPGGKYVDTGSTNAIGGPAQGRMADDPAVDSPVLNAYITHKIDDAWSVGFGMNTPYGLSTDYSGNFVGRYTAQETKLLTLNFNPSVAYRVNEHLTLGFGISAQYATATLSKKIDSAAVCNGSVLAGACASWGLGLGEIGTGNVDSASELEGDDWGWGWNIGVMIDLAENTRMGVTYRSPVGLKLEGDAKFKNSPEFQDFVTAAGGAGLDVFTKTGGTVDITMPAMASIAVAHEFGDWMLMGDITWTEWSTFEELRIVFDSDQPDSVTEENWQDTFRFGAGVTYMLGEKWKLRSGLAYDQTPVKSRYFRTPAIPDNDRIWLSFGFGFQMTEAMVFDFGYSHLFVEDAKLVHSTDQQTLVANIEEGDTDIISMGLTFSF